MWLTKSCAQPDTGCLRRETRPTQCGLSSLVGKTVQLLLTDVVLPDRDGCDLALELERAENGLKAIFISGIRRIPSPGKALQHPGWFYLPKPFSAVSLLRKVKEALNELPMP